MLPTYFANPVGSNAVRAAMHAGTLGFIDTPRQRNSRPPGVAWCADNSCFGSGYPGDVEYLAWLAKQQPGVQDCVFATAPDVVGDAAATLVRSKSFLPVIRAMGYPAAFVAQDGLEDLKVPWDTFDVLFIGGGTNWKLGPGPRGLVREAKDRGKHVHMGRVNSGKRYRYAIKIGCDTTDGTFLTYGPDVNLPRLLRWFGPGPILYPGLHHYTPPPADPTLFDVEIP